VPGDFNREALRIGIDTRLPAARVVRDDMINILDHFAPESLDFITTGHTLEPSLAPLIQLLGLPLTITAHRHRSNK